MAAKYDNVIVFGPTGQVGSAAALEASKRGAKVWLAMRDTAKTISGIPDEPQQKDRFTRIKSDLSDSEAVKAAIQQSGAKAAFVYLIHAPGGLQNALKAMKEAGVEYVVFLSSFTITPDANIREIQPMDAIPYVHAQAEIALEDLGIAHTSLRPASFASNPFEMLMDTSKTPNEMVLFSEGKRPVDNIVPWDIGRVGGAVLVDRPSASAKEVIYLFGPNLITEFETAKMVQKHHTEELALAPLPPDQWAERMKGRGVPPPLVDYMLRAQEQKAFERLTTGSLPKEGTANIKKYSGYEPTTFEEYLKSRGGN